MLTMSYKSGACFVHSPLCHAGTDMAYHDDIQVDTLIPFMRDVGRCERSLHELSLMWRLIEASAKMNCAEEAHGLLPMMAATREGFRRLENDLVQSMVAEAVTAVMTEISTCAHHVMDIVVRNLYERTADVGFLASDQTLSRYAAGLSDREGIVERLKEYQRKYSVYDEILLLDAQGAVITHIDTASPVQQVQDPLLAHTFQSKKFVETFRATPLRPGKAQALIYSHRMLHPETAQVCGVLCLSFDFESEMRTIFSGSSVSHGRYVAMLLDADNRILASSDAHWMPTGSVVPINQNGAAPMHNHSGRTYLVQTVKAVAYQGYAGPSGWQCQVMIPIEQAFGTKTMHCTNMLTPRMAQGLLNHAPSFCPPLSNIIQAAQAIRRVVWNGQVMTAGQRGSSSRLKSVLEEIGETGVRTNEVFAQSIRSLFDTVLSASVKDSQTLTQLLVDLLDRNLYERANDCRWWALSPVLRQLLTEAHTQGTSTAALQAEATQVLEHINSLYTVYTRLMVYDAQGRILCATNPVLRDGSNVLDQHIDSSTLQAVMQLSSSQDYYVSPWNHTHSGADQATYIYHAPIRQEGDAAHTIGGIAIVFNAQSEMLAMLSGALNGKPKTHAMYVNRQGLVLASTDPAIPSGSTLELPCPQLLQVQAGGSEAVITSYQQQYCILGASVTRGYREFKTTDGYRDEVLAISVENFGTVDSQIEIVNPEEHKIMSSSTSTNHLEVATFYLGSQVFALPAESVLEALPASSISPVSADRLPYCLGTLARHAQGLLTSYVWVFDLHEVLTGKRSRITAQSQVLVLQLGTRKLGVLVCDLHGVHAFAQDSIIPMPSLRDTEPLLIQTLIKANHGALLLQCIDPQSLLQILQTPSAPRTAAQPLDCATVL